VKTKQTILIALFGVSNLPLLAEQPSNLPKAKITVHVTDQDGKPVEGALVGIGGTMNPKPGEAAKGLTTAEGFFSAEVGTNGGVGTSARKDGYYVTFGPEYRFGWDRLEKAGPKGRLEPWNPILELLLKKILNPIPMSARSVESKLPVEAMGVGFDLELGDWVFPYGAGKVSDFIFRVDRTITTERNYSATLQLSFSNKNDGLIEFRAPPFIGSMLKSPHTAPELGYVPLKVWRQARSPGKPGAADTFVEDVGKDQNYIFRIRTILENNGQVVSALYGKIYGDVRLYIGTKAPKAGIGFTYYLNPTPNDQNIEFDPKRNLFTNLKADERVTQP
jgi:hypothetical protein